MDGVPIRPVNETVLLPLETEADVATLIAAIRAVKAEPSEERRDDLTRDLGDHLAFLAGARPELFRPYRDQVLQLPEEDRRHVSVSFGDLVVLMAGASDDSVDHLLRELEAAPDDLLLTWLLASIASDHALRGAAEHARRHGTQGTLQKVGVWVPEEGPARLRFTPTRRAVFKRPLGPGETTRSCRHPVGLPVEEAVRRTQGLVTWHYLTLDLRDLPGVPGVRATRLPLVSPRENWGWTLFLDIDREGGVTPSRVEDDGGEDIRPRLRAQSYLRHLPRPLADLWLALRYGDEEESLDFDEMLRAQEREGGGEGKAELRPYDADLVYRNGHIQATEGVVGTAGGPPIGIYAPPSCPSCARLMFHLLSVTHHVRDYGDGFRSLFLCEDCHTAACQATSWN